MNNLNRYSQNLTKWIMAIACLIPALTWAHGGVDIPVARQIYCYTQSDFWNNPKDKGCAAINAISGTYPGQQWNEVAKLLKQSNGDDYNNQNDVERLVPDGELCSAGDSLKKGLNALTANWHKTTVTPNNGTIDVRIIGTAPHVPSFVKIYLSKPGYNPLTTALRWSDLQLVHSESMTVAKTNWGSTPPAIAGASGFFDFKVALPPSQTGDAVLFVRWQRVDPDGEGFYNCSDITIAGPGIPVPFYDIGEFIDAVMNILKPGDAVHFRILDNTPAAKEVVDITLPITAANLDPNIWGSQLANQIDPSIAKVGEQKGTNIVFNANDYSANSLFVVAKGYSKAMAIIPGGGPAPTPQAEITGPTKLISGQTYTFNGALKNAQNAPQYAWAPILITPVINQQTVTGVAPVVGQSSNYTVRLNARDGSNGPSYQATLSITVEPANSGGYPPYQAGTTYKAGDKVSHNGGNYECKPWPATGWCSLPAYEPGDANGNWVNAWDKL